MATINSAETLIRINIAIDSLGEVEALYDAIDADGTTINEVSGLVLTIGDRRKQSVIELRADTVLSAGAGSEEVPAAFVIGGSGAHAAIVRDALRAAGITPR